MPFHTDVGPAVLVENVVDVYELARRLGVHTNTIYHWARERESNKFPRDLPFSSSHNYDYAEVFDWYKEWVLNHPDNYPKAYIAFQRGKI